MTDQSVLYTFHIKPFVAESFDEARHAQVAALHTMNSVGAGQLVSIEPEPDGSAAVTFKVPVGPPPAH